jgi:hypothetical protein
MLIKQQRLQRLSRTLSASCTAEDNSSPSSLSLMTIKQPGSTCSTCGRRDEAPITPQRRLSKGDLSGCFREGKVTHTPHTDGDCEDSHCANNPQQIVPLPWCNTDSENIIEVDTQEKIPCCSSGVSPIAVSMSESSSSPHECLLTFSSVGKKTRILDIPCDCSSAHDSSSSSCDCDGDIIPYADCSANLSTIKPLQHTESIGSTIETKDNSRKSSLQMASYLLSSLFLHDEDASITSLSSTATIRASNSKLV